MDYRAARTQGVLAISMAVTATLFVVVGVLEWAWSVADGAPPELVAFYPLCAWVYCAVGVIATVRRPNNATGPLLLVGGASVLLAGLIITPQPALIGVGMVAATLPLATVIHVLHAVPTGHITGRWSLLTVVGAYVVSVVLQFPRYAWGGPSPLQIADNPQLYEAGTWLQRSAGLVVIVSTAAILVRRLATYSRGHRRRLAPLYAYGIVAVLFISLSASLLGRDDPLLLFKLQLGVLAGVPVAFLVVMAVGGFARVGDLGHLQEATEGTLLDHDSITQALATALGDDSVKVRYWSPTADGFVDQHGALAPADPEPDRGAAMVSLGGAVIASIDYDGRIVGDRRVVDLAGHLLALAIDRSRVTADLRVQRAELVAAGHRIVSAGDHERRRIARDLHDGLQTRLVLLALAAHDISTNPSAADTVRDGIDGAIKELRDLVHGVMPATLTERGLDAALRELADLSPLPVAVAGDTDGRRYDPATETVAYLAVREALSNAAKYGQAGAVAVAVAEQGETVRVTVTDDGVGGAQILPGHGLAGIRDRVLALQGTFSLGAAPTGGTRLEVALPCVW